MPITWHPLILSGPVLHSIHTGSIRSLAEQPVTTSSRHGLLSHPVLSRRMQLRIKAVSLNWRLHLPPTVKTNIFLGQPLGFPYYIMNGKLLLPKLMLRTIPLTNLILLPLLKTLLPMEPA